MTTLVELRMRLEWNGCERIPPLPGRYRWRLRIAADRLQGTDRACRFGIPVPKPVWPLPPDATAPDPAATLGSAVR